MIKLLKFYVIFILFVLTSGFVHAVTIATDTIYLYEDGKRVTNSSWMHDVYDYAPSCKKGVCYIQQGHTPTFYKTQEKNVLDHEEFCNKHDCRSKSHDAYVDELRSTAGYSIKVDVPVSTGGEDCKPLPGQETCLGGRVGTPRNFRLDVETGELSQNVPSTILFFRSMSSFSPVILVASIPILAIAIMLLKKLLPKAKK